MKTKQINICFSEFDSAEQMDAQDRMLVREALEAIKGSYAPYSHFNVGAAVLTSGGHVVRGANQENAAYPSGLCAERTAMFAAGAQYPDEDIVSLAVAGGFDGKPMENPATPCGACRQVMAQCQTRSGKPMSVILVGNPVVWKFDRVDDILPLIFDSI